MKPMNSLKSLCLSISLILPSVLWADRASDYKDGGLALLRAGQYAKAVDYFKNAVQANPNDAEAYQDLGDAYVKLGDNENARSAYQKCLDIDPNNGSARSSLNDLGSAPGTDSNSGGTFQERLWPTPTPPTGVNKFDEDSTITQQAEPGNKKRGTTVTYADDGMARMNRAKLWFQADLAYNYSMQTDLIDSSSTFNNGTFVPGNAIAGSNTYTGSSLSTNNGLDFGGELGFLVNPYFGIGLGARVIRTGDYTADVQYDTGDYEHLTLGPEVVPITLDLYLFLPDSGGRFFLTGGTGYYAGVVHVDQTTTSNNFFSTPNGPSPTVTDNWSGDLYSGNIGFQLGVGRDFAIDRGFGVEIFARGRYAKLTNFKGTLYEANNGGTQTYALAASGSAPTVVDAELPQYINSANNERYATLDFTGFDIGAALTFYTY